MLVKMTPTKIEQNCLLEIFVISLQNNWILLNRPPKSWRQNEWACIVTGCWTFGSVREKKRRESAIGRESEKEED